MLEPSEFTPIGLNTWTLGAFTESDTVKPYEALETALDHGINLIDTAPYYGNGQAESIIGDVLKRWRGREDLFWPPKGVWRTMAPGAGTQIDIPPICGHN